MVMYSHNHRCEGSGGGVFTPPPQLKFNFTCIKINLTCLNFCPRVTIRRPRAMKAHSKEKRRTKRHVIMEWSLYRAVTAQLGGGGGGGAFHTVSIQVHPLADRTQLD